ncbi:uncharacterized protein K489DRAFT_127483 [Dissoconium aciculare CBS 342.82]|jgi:hypothetical protein|uniref:Uncharacterized protein n=1 Tax=Dissoconium aciculare CBS 342.82 TaxID=1314786 RepID=A0A6J3LSG6_9PEZI|nr:uncharacterized protein K489DRAFT_127483 [Dissoconium aciculare CBS 342.82]KAF1818234.1 hypothetical protein K489DRAFT_127483 [Dissoconium aciculare CBS 342.82]
MRFLSLSNGLLMTAILSALPQIAFGAPCGRVTSATGIELEACPGDPDPYITHKLAHELEQKVEQDRERRLKSSSRLRLLF